MAGLGSFDELRQAFVMLDGSASPAVHRRTRLIPPPITKLHTRLHYNNQNIQDLSPDLPSLRKANSNYRSLFLAILVLR